MIEVKAYIYKDNLPYGLYTIGQLDESDCFTFLNEEIKKDCLETLKKEFSYIGSVGATITIPDFKENKKSKSTESILRNEKTISQNAQMIAEDGYILAYKTFMLEAEDGKKYILTYDKNDFQYEDEINHLS